MNKPHETHPTRENLEARIRELDAQNSQLAELNQGQFLQLEYLRPIFDAAKVLSDEAEEYDFADGLGQGALQQYWDALNDALEPKTEAIEKEMNRHTASCEHKRCGYNAFMTIGNCYDCGAEYFDGEWHKKRTITQNIAPMVAAVARHKGAKPWFSNSTEAIRWIRDEARQFYTDNPQVAAHLFETATIFERELYAANARIAELEKMVK